MRSVQGYRYMVNPKITAKIKIKKNIKVIFSKRAQLATEMPDLPVILT